MAIKGQNSCTLSTITDVKSIYTYHLLVPSTTVVINNMAPKDATTDNPGNPPGASSITITYLGNDYVWTISEPGINIQTNDIGTLYYIECTLFSDNTFDWGPIMTSSSYEAAKQAFNKATIVSNLVGDSPQHFWWLTTGDSTGIPAGAYITYVSQESFKSNPNNQPNLLLQSEGISLRNGLITKAQMTSTGLEILEGGIKGGQPESELNKFIYVSTEDYPLRTFDKVITPIEEELDVYYELIDGNYVFTSDTEVDDNKIYYIVNTEGVGVNNYIPTKDRYIPTEDTTYNSNKVYYYLENKQYIQFEEFILTTDTEIDETKTYYTYNIITETYEIVEEPEPGTNPHQQNYYEQNNFNPNITYFEYKNDNAWREIIGSNFGVDSQGILYAAGAHISGALNVSGNSNIYTKTEVNHNIETTANNIKNDTIYAYSNNSEGIEYVYDDSTLKYRGILTVTKHIDGEVVIPIEGFDPDLFKWELNPFYAATSATDYLMTIEGGIKLGQAGSNSYLSLSPALMQFWLDSRARAKFGYDEIYEAYGITVENVMITGAGNALRLDNGVNGAYQGQFILETRSNGHISLKPGLSRTEEDDSEEIEENQE